MGNGQQITKPNVSTSNGKENELRTQGYKFSHGQQITKLNVSTSKAEENELRAQGYDFINVNLNQGTCGNQVFLWYMKEHGNPPVTRIQFSFDKEMKSGLVVAGYELVNRDLNAGNGGDHIFLWYFYGNTEYDFPIVDLEVTVGAQEEPGRMLDGWERLGCDLNRNAGGNFIYLWVKREKLSYICEITASVEFNADNQMFKLGYTRLDENTNRRACGSFVFLWYRRTTEKNKALTALDVSTSPTEELQLQTKGFKAVSVNLNQGTSGPRVMAWYRAVERASPVRAMVLLINPVAWKEYPKKGINFIDKNLNIGNDGCKMYLAYL